MTKRKFEPNAVKQSRQRGGRLTQHNPTHAVKMPLTSESAAKFKLAIIRAYCLSLLDGQLDGEFEHLDWVAVLWPSL